MGQHHEIRFPGECEAYRAARDALLTAEMELRRKSEEVAALRRALPPGGVLKEDYLFDEGDRQTRLSELFSPGKSSLVVYGFMFPPDGAACPACTALLDGLNDSAPHIRDRVDLAVVAKAPVEALRAWAAERARAASAPCRCDLAGLGHVRSDTRGPRQRLVPALSLRLTAVPCRRPRR